MGVGCIYNKIRYSGIGSAALLYQYERNRTHASVVPFLYPINHTTNLKVDHTVTSIILIDCFNEELAESLISKGKSIMVIESHKHLFDAVKKLGCKNILDDSKSVIMITWEYLFPKQEPPDWIRWIQIYDLRLKDDPEWKEANLFHLGMKSFPKYKDPAITGWEIPRFSLMTQQIKIAGQRILCYKRENDKAAMKNAFILNWHDREWIAVNALHLDIDSFACYENFRKYNNFLAFYLKRIGGKKVWSVRIRSNKDPIGEIAKEMGGGGHPLSAAFTVNDLRKIGLVI